MKPWIVLSGIILLGCAAIMVSERQRVDTQVSAEPVLHLVGDTEQEISRLPVRLTRISDEEEVRIGDELAKGYAENWNPAGEKKTEFAEVEKYLNAVGSRVAQHTERKLPYRFHYIPQLGFVNAFALPGGHVFVGAGLIAMMDSEDELAAVLGHEIEHVDLRHCAERVQTEARLRKLHLEPLGDLIAIPASVFEAGYNKEQELAADRDGTRLAVKGNYSPLGAVRMFEALQVFEDPQRRPPSSPQDELAQLAHETLEGYFRSHPPSAERAQRIKESMAAESWPVKAETNLAIGYIYWVHAAERAYAALHYDRAVALCRRALTVRADYPQALEVLGDASFFSAHFAEAADAYRRRLQESRSPEMVRKYTESLAARGPNSAAPREYGDWLRSTHVPSAADFELELAGLKLLAGDGSAAQKLSDQLRLSEADPGARGRLGWWFYRVGQYDTARELLAGAVEERPQSREMQAALAWTLIERRQYETALTRFSQTGESTDTRMGKAVVYWQTKSPDDALTSYGSAISMAPYWQNSRWVNATQSPLVQKTLTELETERKAREEKRKQKSGAAPDA